MYDPYDPLGGLRRVLDASWPLGRLFGIELRVYWTAVLVYLATMYELSSWPGVGLGDAALTAAVIQTTIYAIVLVHELCHAWAARRYGVRTSRITLSVLGGLAHLSASAPSPRADIVISAAGPASHVPWVAIAWALRDVVPPMHVGRWATIDMMSFLLWTNVALAAFNLLPCFPMDGGRILRALLVPRRGLVGATRIAATVGKLFAVLFAAWGVMSLNLILLLIAFFVFVGADAEARAVLVDAVLGRVLVGDLMSARAQPIAAEASVDALAERMLRERRLAYPVVTRDGKLLGVATLEALKSVPPERRVELVVAQIAQPAPTVSPRDDVARALRLMSEADTGLLAVVDDGQLVGLIGRDEIGRALALSELQQRPLSPKPA